MSTSIYLRTGGQIDTTVRAPSAGAFRNEALLGQLHTGPIPIAYTCYRTIAENAAGLLEYLSGTSQRMHDVSPVGLVVGLAMQAYGATQFRTGQVTFNRTRLDTGGTLRLDRLLDPVVTYYPNQTPAPPTPGPAEIDALVLAFLGMGRIGRSFADPNFRLDLTSRLNSLIQGISPGFPAIAHPFPLTDNAAHEPPLLQLSAAIDILATAPGSGIQNLRFGTVDTAGDGQATLGLVSLLDGMCPGDGGVAPWIFSGAAASQLAALFGPGNVDQLGDPSDIGIYACPLSGGGVSVYGGSSSPDLYGILALAGCGVGNIRCVNARPPGTPAAPSTLMLNAGALAYCCARGTLDLRFAPAATGAPTLPAPQLPQPGGPPTAASPYWEWAVWLRDNGSLPPDCVKYLQTMAQSLNPRPGSFGEEFVNLVAML